MTANKTQAIQTALNGDWTTAITLNKKLLKENPEDIETLNRLALAFTVVGKIKDAKNTYQKVLKLDGQNPIALKNVKRLGSFNRTKNQQTYSPMLSQNVATIFLEETGKTKVIELINVAEPKIIYHLMTGEIVGLHAKRLKIFVLDIKKQYIGMLPDDIGKRLIKFIKGGNIYEAAIKAVLHNRVIIFIREVKRTNKFKNQPSFQTADKTKMSIAGKTYQSDKEMEEVVDEAEEDESA